MKWFKHMSNSSTEGQFIAALEDEYGLEGYARYFKLLEAVASKMDETDNTSVTYPIEKWASLLKQKQNKVISFLVHLENQRQINWKRNGNLLTVDIPKMLDLRDEWTRRKVDLLRSNSHKKEDTDKDLRKKEKIVKKEKPTDKKTRAVRLPEDFSITEPMKAWATKSFQTVDEDWLTSETEKFKDYHTAKASLFSDWVAAWRTWMRNANQWAKNKPKGGATAPKFKRYEVLKAEDIKESGVIQI